MFGTDIVALATQLAAADPAVCDRDALAELVKTAQRARGWLDAFDARIALQAARLAEAGACEVPVAVLAGDGRRSTKDAEAVVGRAGVCMTCYPTLTLHPDRNITLTRPDGTIHFEGSTIDVAPTGLPPVEAEIIELARTRTRHLGPPARAPAA
jgi:hypothetical protein